MTQMIQLIAIFLRLGTLGFGGPFALIALMESEFVEKRKWLSAEKFQQAFSMIKVFPGATATQVAIYIARSRAGNLGGFIGGTAFLLPSILFVLLLSVLYVRFHEVPQVSSLFQGMQLAALIVIADSVIRMARPYSKSARAGVIALLSGVVIFLRPGLEPLLILGFGLFGVARMGRRINALGVFGLTRGLAGGLPGVLQFSGSFSTTLKLSMICLKAGFLIFGTGLAIIPVLEADIVGNHHWLTHAEFLDGLAIGQITPGPVSTTATFIGYKVGGLSGAICATIAIFASAYFNMLVTLPILESRLRGSSKLKDFTDWAFPAVIGGIIATSLRLGISTVSTGSICVWLICLTVILFKFRPPPWAFIPLSGIAIFVGTRWF